MIIIDMQNDQIIGKETLPILIGKGQAKAVMLTHHNMQSNLEQMRMVFRITPQDRFCGVLPLFHVIQAAFAPPAAAQARPRTTTGAGRPRCRPGPTCTRAGGRRIRSCPSPSA